MLPTWIVPTRHSVFLFLVKMPVIREMRSIEIQVEDLNSDLRVLLGRSTSARVDRRCLAR